jgi:hypothetical protein
VETPGTTSEPSESLVADAPVGERGGRGICVLQYVVLIAFGTAVSLYFGRLGFMPLDHGIAFDGGWRVLCGQVPFRDFAAPNCIPVFVAQAAFFGLFGVSWFVYCLHAALVNGLFCLTIYAILRRLNASGPVAFGYGLLSGLALYPLIGSPFMEQHAFFLTAVAILATLQARHTSRARAKWLLYGMIPPLLATAFLCKQNPSGFVGPLMLLVVFLIPEPNRDWRVALASLAAGTAFTFLVVGLLILGLHLDAGAIWYYVFEMPLQIGRHRAGGRAFQQLLSEIQAFVGWTAAPAVVGGLCTAAAAHRVLAWVRTHSGKPGYRLLLGTAWISTIIAAAVILYGTQRVFYPAAWFVFAFSVLLFVATVWRTNAREVSFRFGPLLLAASLYALSFAFVLTTKNQAENGYPFRFLSLGIAVAETCRAIRSKRKWAVILLCTLCLLVTCGEVIRVGRATFSREVNDMTYRPEAAKPCTVKGLRFLSFYLPSERRMSSSDLDMTVAFLRRNPGNFLLVGDFSILYGLTGKPSIPPSLWFHYGLSLPPQGTPQFEEYQDTLVRRCEEYEVRYLVLEPGDVRANATTLNDFPRLGEAITGRRQRRMDFGGFSIVELTPPLGEPASR